MALKGNVGPFVTLFGGSAGEPEQDFQATIHQALFFNNAGQLNRWVTARPGGLTDRVRNHTDPQAAVEELYLAVFSRMPDEAERREAIEYMMRDPETKLDSIQQMVWALLTSSEFRFSH